MPTAMMKIGQSIHRKKEYWQAVSRLPTRRRARLFGPFPTRRLERHPRATPPPRPVSDAASHGLLSLPRAVHDGWNTQFRAGYNPLRCLPSRDSSPHSKDLSK